MRRDVPDDSRLRAPSEDRAATIRTCTECGGSTPKWQGKCPSCGAWNTLAGDSATLPTPMSTCGTRMLQLFKPNRRTDSAIGHRAAGGLSTVIEFAASEEPKKNACHDREPACTAAE